MAHYSSNNLNSFFIDAELGQLTNWRIPRPSLAHQKIKSSHHQTNGSISSSSNGTSSTSSQKSQGSTTLLLSAKNLAEMQHEIDNNSNRFEHNITYYLNTNNNNIKSTDKNDDNFDKASIASSMNFTIINTNDKNVIKRSFCRKHQLTILVVTMSCLFSIAILIAIYFLEVRAQRSF